MANEHYEAVMKNPVKGLRGTKQIVLLHLSYRYDTRPTKDGKPNRGYLKSYPGMSELCSVTGVSRQAVNTATEALIADGLVTRVTIGKPGRQAEFQPVYAMEILGEHVNLALHVSKTSKIADSDKIATVTRKPGLQIVSRRIDTISIKSIKSTEPYNAERFTSILEGVPKELRSRVEPGDNLEKRLNELAHLKVSNDAIRACLNGKSWQNVTTPGAIVQHVLDDLITTTKDSLAQAEDRKKINELWREELEQAHRNASSNSAHWAEVARQQMKGDQG